MTIKKAIIIVIGVLFLHGIGVFFDLYRVTTWYDIPMHLLGGFAMGCLGLGIWLEGVQEVHFSDRLKRYMNWLLVPLFVIGFVSFISIAWEWHEFFLDKVVGGKVRQPGLDDTMMDLLFDLVGGVFALAIYYTSYARR